MKFFNVRQSAICLAAALAFGGPAWGDTVEYGAEMGSGSGFAFSWIHAATNKTTIDGVDFYASGTKLFKITDGVLRGSLVEDNGGWKFTTVETTMTLSVNKTDAVKNEFGITDAGGAWTMVIDAGGMITDVNSSGNVGASGSLGYAILQDGVERNAGTWWFFDENFTGTDPIDPNNIDDTQASLWGNNWDNVNGTIPSSQALGIDFHGEATVVPLPAAAWPGLVCLAGMIGLVAARRRRAA